MSNKAAAVQSHSKHVLFNTIFGLLNIVLIFVGAFVIRKFINTYLGEELLGLQSLLADILTVLTLANNAVSLATIFILYNPLAKKEYARAKAFIKIFNRFYLILTFIILGIGVGIAFVYPMFINSELPYRDLVMYFLLLALQAGLGYPFNAYKNLLMADEKARYISIAHMTLRFICYFAQCVVIAVFKSFVLYSVINIAVFFFESLVCFLICKKMYKHISNAETIKLEKKEVAVFYKKMAPALVQGIGSTIIVLSSGFIISFLPNLGLAIVAVYSAYSTILEAFKNVYSQFYASFTSSFGQYIQTSTKDEAYYIYKKAMFFTRAFAFFTAIGFCLLGSLVVSIWLGDSFVLQWYDVFIFGVGLFVYLLYVPSYSVQNCTALHSKDLLVPFIQGGLNFGLSIWLGRTMGITGVILASTICYSIPLFTKEFVVHKFFFKGHLLETIFFHLHSVLLTIPLALGCSLLSTTFTYDSGLFFQFIKYFIMVLSLGSLLFIVLYNATPEFKYWKNKIFSKLH